MPEAFTIYLRQTILIFRKELASYFDSAVAYIALVVFLLISGWFFSSSFFLINESDLRVLFSMIPIMYLFFIPAITMGLLAREKSAGTIELLVTLPIADGAVVLGKYLAAMALLGVALLFTLLHFITLVFVSSNVDVGALLSGYLGLLLVGGVYAAIGIFCSAITDNQITAFIGSFMLVFILFVLSKVIIFVPGFMSAFVQYISIDFHLTNISRGVIDSRNLVYFGSMIFLFLTLAVRVLEMRKWR
ncbi:MAG: ABC transporter permease subunit [Candidatus Marinimicrobia bacterium]|nr:ABC transporter permease subunit [Candidatus Neomarinimicrobiota bacterium]